MDNDCVGNICWSALTEVSLLVCMIALSLNDLMVKNKMI